MNNPDAIRSVVARFFNVAEADVTDSFVFPVRRLQGSAARATLHAAIKRLAGADLPAAYTATTFGQLIAPEVEPSNPQPAPPASAPDPATANAPTPSSPVPDAIPAAALGASSIEALGVGIDVEFTESLVVSENLWTDPFCLENFTQAEIAYCVRRTNPKLSLCGLWSAKEAVIKCGHGAGLLKPKDIEINHDKFGRPLVRILSEKEAKNVSGLFEVSISHSASMSAAVCVFLPRPKNVKKPSAAASLSALPSVTSFSEPSRPGGAPVMSPGWRNLIWWFNLAFAIAAIILILQRAFSK